MVKLIPLVLCLVALSLVIARPDGSHPTQATKENPEMATPVLASALVVQANTLEGNKTTNATGSADDDRILFLPGIYPIVGYVVPQLPQPTRPTLPPPPGPIIYVPPAGENTVIVNPVPGQPINVVQAGTSGG